jgi:hypothetical protein
MNTTLDRIREALIEKRYSIEEDSNCDCVISYELKEESGGVALIESVESDSCWYTDALFIDNTPICDCAFGYVRSRLSEVSDKEIEDLLCEFGIVLHNFSDIYDVPEHKRAERLALMRLLQDKLIPCDWTFWRDPLGECINILLAPGVTPRENWEPCCAADWVEGYFYKGWNCIAGEVQAKQEQG